MHESSLVRALLRQVEALAEQHPHGCVTMVRVRVGEFSGIEPELLRSAYDRLVANTQMHGAELQMETVRLEATCQQCGNRFFVEQFHFECAACGNVRTTICGGEDLILESVSIEEAET